MKKDQKDPGLRVRSTRDFRLKDYPATRRIQFIDLKTVFGFIPEVIAIEKMAGKNNRLILRAILTDEEIKREDKIIEKNTKSKKDKKEK